MDDRPVDDPSKSHVLRRRSRLVYTGADNPFVSVYYDDVEWPDGRQGRYNRIIEGTGVPGVAVLPIHADGIGLIQVDRYAVNRRLWEIPRGFGEGSSAPAENARRELLEETGWIADRLVNLGSVFLNSGLLAGHVELFAAFISNATPQPRDGEAVDVAIFSLDQVRRAITDSRLPDVVTQSALLLASTKGLLQF